MPGFPNLRGSIQMRDGHAVPTFVGGPGNEAVGIGRIGEIPAGRVAQGSGAQAVNDHELVLARR